jgi:hypothetical protein
MNAPGPHRRRARAVAGVRRPIRRRSPQPGLAECGLVLHLWARRPPHVPGGSLPGPLAGVPDGLLTWWDAFLAAGIPETVDGAPLRPTPDRAGAAAAGPFVIRALALMPDDGASAVLYDYLDVTGVVAAVAPAGATTWQGLERLLPPLPDDRDGSALLHIAVTAGADTLHDVTVQDVTLHGAAGQDLPVSAQTLARMGAPGAPAAPGCRVAPQVTAWEVPRPVPGPVDGQDRSFLALADAPEAQDALYRWCAGITAGRWGISALGRALLAGSTIRATWQQVPHLCAAPSPARPPDPSRQLQEVMATDPPSWPEDAADQVSRTWHHTIEAARLRSLRLVTEAALANLGHPDDDAAPLLAYDRELGRRLVEQLRILELGNEVSARSADALRDAYDRATREREQRLTLLQTSFLGALVTGLGAVQAFQLTVPGEPAVIWPVVALIVAVALAVPPLTMRRADRLAGRPAGVRRPQARSLRRPRRSWRPWRRTRREAGRP